MSEVSNNSLPEFGRWQAVELLGRGGQGVAYRATHRGRQAVIKWFICEIPDERFAREVDALKKVKRSTGLPRIGEQGMRDGHPWLAMDFEEGETLAKFAGANQSLLPARWLNIALSLTGALRNAHAAGVVHRDIKPANAIVDAYDRTTLIDFGLAVIDDRHSQTNQADVLGTLAYMAPEGMSHGALTLSPPSDIYSLAATLTHLAYGGMPDSVAARGVLANEGWGEAAANLPEAWRFVALRESLSLDPQDRPTAQQLFRELSAIPPESVAATGGLPPLVARRIGTRIADFAQDDYEWGRVRDWVQIAYDLGYDEGADYLAHLVESFDGLEAALPYWRSYAEQRPVAGNITLYRKLCSVPGATADEMEAAKELLFRAGEAGGFEFGEERLAREFLRLRDYSSALRSLEALDDGNAYAFRALCHFRLGMEPPSPPSLPRDPKFADRARFNWWWSAARACERYGLADDAEWLREQIPLKST